MHVCVDWNAKLYIAIELLFIISKCDIHNYTVIQLLYADYFHGNPMECHIS